MKLNNSLKRREFLQYSTAMVIAGLGSNLACRAAFDDSLNEAVNKVGTFPRRKLGYSGREVSVLIGAGGLAPSLVDAGIKCGMNYWHKANQWARTGTPEAILKNRDAHYCQITVDRIGGNHETGRIDEQSHYDFVKEILKQTKLGYFDDIQFHFGYHNTAEVKNDRGFVRAFERLKKEGLVKHLCLSQHGYAGNARVPGGQSAAEVLTLVVEDGLYEHAQIMYSYGEDPATNRFLEFARKKNFGTIAMKTTRGIGRMNQDTAFMKTLPAGTSPHNALTRWLTTVAKIDLAVIQVRNFAEFIDTYSGAGRTLRSADARAIELMTARADATACRLCTECQPYCPQQVPIAEILRFDRYASDNRDLTRARALYAGLDRRADACVACGSCIEHCPQKLQIPERLAAAHTLLSRA
ncbi:MAG: hypothetical protein JXA73_23580 [Acidobacteria bacterium]|nr:hypothetical protein [Acidobacteriota bacterium]